MPDSGKVDEVNEVSLPQIVSGAVSNPCYAV